MPSNRTNIITYPVINDLYSFRRLLIAALGGVFILFALSGCGDPADPPTLSSSSGATNNTPPSALFTSSCTNLDCSFNAGGSLDSDGSIVSYAWDFGDGNSGSTVTSNHTYSADGNYTVMLTITDDAGATAQASQDLFVSSGNAPPAASFSSNCPDLSCTFDASASTDDVSIASYSWDFGDGNNGGTVAPGHTYTADGNYTVVLTVTDGDGASSNSSQTVSVSAAGGGNNPPSATFTTTCTDLSCNFDASASTDDVGIASYAWDFGDGANGNTVTAGHIYSTDGSYTVVLTVTDGDGASSNSQQTLSVSSGNNPPSAGFTFSCTELICNFDGSISIDGDGTVTSYAWDFGDTTIGSGVTTSHTYTLDGSYSVILTVTDDDGADSATAQSVTVSSGQSLFMQKCSTCHGADAQGGTLAKIDIRGKTAAEITTAISTIKQMSSLSSLTATEIQQIADYLATL